MKKILFLSFICCIFMACGKKSQSSETNNELDSVCVEEIMSEIIEELYDDGQVHSVYIPENFEEYITTPFNGTVPSGRFDYEKDIQPAIHALQAFYKGKRKYYPQEQAVRCIKILQHNWRYSLGHVADEELDMQAFRFFQLFLTLAVRTTPDMNFLSNVCSMDHRIGTLRFHDGYSLCPYYALIWEVEDERFDIHWITTEEQMYAYTHIRLLAEDEERLRYLLTYEDKGMIWPGELLALVADYYWESGELKTYSVDISEEDLAQWLEVDFDYAWVDFNPNKLQWVYCYVNEGSAMPHPIKNSPILKLHFQEQGAYFTVD